MTFTELNSVEHFIIHNLTGVNLNNVRSGMVKEEPVGYGKCKMEQQQTKEKFRQS